MYKILKKTQFSEKVFEFRVEAPQMAKKAHAGQFLMVRANEQGERVPFTLAGWNAEEGWIEFIFMDTSDLCIWCQVYFVTVQFLLWVFQRKELQFLPCHDDSIFLHLWIHV